METIFNAPLNNKLALVSLILAKFVGLIGITLGFIGLKTIGMTLLILDGLLILTTIILSLFQMRNQNKGDKKDIDLIEKMVRDGSIYQKLNDIGLEIKK